MTSLKMSKKLKKIGFKAKHEKTWMQYVYINDKGIIVPAKTYTLYDGVCEHNGDLKLYPSYDADTLFDYLINWSTADGRDFEINSVETIICTYVLGIEETCTVIDSQSTLSDTLALTIYKLFSLGMAKSNPYWTHGEHHEKKWKEARKYCS